MPSQGLQAAETRSPTKEEENESGMEFLTHPLTS
jgi:hypothetical protein